jgi:ElaB/YqjD/DUF883 family membrane-anchored ribosome-binding protein
MACVPILEYADNWSLYLFIQARRPGDCRGTAGRVVGTKLNLHTGNISIKDYHIMARQSESTEKIHEALALLNEAAREKKDELGQMLHGKYDALKDTVLSVQSDVVDHAKQGVRKTEDLGAAAAERAKEAAAAIDRKAHDDPWRILGWSVAGAFLVGLLVGRKH